VSSASAPRPPARPGSARVVALIVAPCLALSAGTGLLLASPASATTTRLDLAGAGPVAVLAAAAVTNDGPSVLSGDLDVSPGTSVTGFPPGIIRDGGRHVADDQADAARTGATAAYVSANGRPGENVLLEDPGAAGLPPLTPGVYDAGFVNLTGTLVLDGGGDPEAVFLFRLSSTLTTAATSVVRLVGRAQSCNVFWTVGSSATLGASSTFVGTILAHTSITTGNQAVVDGRLLAGVVAPSGAVTLDDTDVTRPVCANAPPAGGGAPVGAVPPAGPTPTPTPTPTAAPSATPTVSPGPGAGPTGTATAVPSATTDGAATRSPAGGTASDGAASGSAGVPTGLAGAVPSSTASRTRGSLRAGSPVTAGGSSTDGDRRLPRTGSDSGDLALAGLAALVLGGVLVTVGQGPGYVPRHRAARGPRSLTPT
jgi:LPXTG-motif cell wall-anchored protein